MHWLLERNIKILQCAFHNLQSNWNTAEDSTVVTFVIVRTPDSGQRNYRAGHHQQLQWLTIKMCLMSIIQLQMQCGNNIHFKVVKLLNRWKIDFVRLGIREKLQFLPNFTIILPFPCLCCCCNRRTDI